MADMTVETLAAQLAPRANQAYVKFQALEGGTLSLPEHLFVTDAGMERVMNVPSMSFLIQHPSARMVFDLGLKKNLSNYPASMQTHISNRQPITTSPDVADSLRAGGIDPRKDIDYVMMSHVHWDHIGTPEDFPNSQFVVGSGTLHLLAHGALPHYPAEQFNPLPAGTLELPPYPDAAALGTAAKRQTAHTWAPLATFPAAIDFFHDGSVFVIDSPGHLPGHVNLLLRISPTKWVLLGGDCCHDPRILNGEKDIAFYDDGHGGKRSVHADTHAAQKTIDNIKRFREEVNIAKQQGNDLDVEVIVAHDQKWRARNPSRFLAGKA